jgi:hypothetical protein
VPAAHTAKADRAVLPAGGDVAGLGAHPVGDGDLADCAAGVFGVQQGLGLAPDAVAVAVELHRGDPVDGLATALLPNAVVPLRRGQVVVVHQLAEHVHWGAVVGVGIFLSGSPSRREGVLPAHSP